MVEDKFDADEDENSAVFDKMKEIWKDESHMMPGDYTPTNDFAKKCILEKAFVISEPGLELLADQKSSGEGMEFGWEIP